MCGVVWFQFLTTKDWCAGLQLGFAFGWTANNSLKIATRSATDIAAEQKARSKPIASPLKRYVILNGSFRCTGFCLADDHFEPRSKCSCNADSIFNKKSRHHGKEDATITQGMKYLNRWMSLQNWMHYSYSSHIQEGRLVSVFGIR
jgi:hypothetical protein